MKITDVIQQVNEFKSSIDSSIGDLQSQIDTITKSLNDMESLKDIPKKAIEAQRKKLEKMLQDKLNQLDKFVRERLKDAEALMQSQKDKVESQVKRQVTRSINSVSAALGGHEVDLDIKQLANDTKSRGAQIPNNPAETLL